MKKTIIFVCLITFVSTGFAKVLRVGFNAVPAIAGQDFATFLAAYNTAVAGDTVYVFPGSILSNGWTQYACDFGCGYPAIVTKKLTIISKGFWLDTASNPKGNANLQSSKGTATFGPSGIYFRPGSEGSVLMGFDGEGSSVAIETSNITIKRNFNLAVNIGNIANNLTVEGNYRVSFGGINDINITDTGIVIKNNFIYTFLLPVQSYKGVIANNTWALDLSGAQNGGSLAMSYLPGEYRFSTINLQNGNWLFQNNLIVFYQGNSPVASPYVITGGDNSILNYNLAIQSTNVTSWPGTGIGNAIISPTLALNIFEAFPAIGTSSADARYRLKAGSPANIASRPGSTEDAGMYGGTTPYKLSGVPNMPTIYSISSPNGNTPSGTSIRVDFKTRTNN